MSPDIAMCKGKDCPLKETCYRHKAKPSDFSQSWFTDSPYKKDTKKCDYYWKEETRKRRVR